jgi:tetratricopeptide (TPR) repeat protein
LGGVQSRDEDVEQSNKLLLAASKADPSNPDPYMYLGLNAFKQHDNATAETYLRKAILLTGDNISRNDYNIRRGYIALARILSSQGEKEEAQVYFDKAKTLSDSQHRSNEEAFSTYLNSKDDTGPAVMYSRPAPKPRCPVTSPRKLMAALTQRRFHQGAQ